MNYSANYSPLGIGPNPKAELKADAAWHLQGVGPQKLIERLKHQRSVLRGESVSMPASEAGK